MSKDLTTVEARERLYACLWAGECTLDGDSRLAIAGHRLWCALREQRFHAEKQGRQLSAYELTENLRRDLFSTVGLTLDTAKFTEWIRGIVPLTSPPSTPYMTAVQAAFFFADGAFLTADDIVAIVASRIESGGFVQSIGAAVNTFWELAELRLFRAHAQGALLLLGRKAPHFGADPIGEHVLIPQEFFAGDVTLSLNNDIHDRKNATRPMYCETAVPTAGFQKIFLARNEPTMPTGKIARPATRQPTKIDEREFRAWAKTQFTNLGFGPSLQEAVEFARERRIARWWARDQHKGLPEELRRLRGGEGSTRHLMKRRQPNSSD
jgi:hypothetical protein